MRPVTPVAGLMPTASVAFVALVPIQILAPLRCHPANWTYWDSDPLTGTMSNIAGFFQWRRCDSPPIGRSVVGNLKNRVPCIKRLVDCVSCCSETGAEDCSTAGALMTGISETPVVLVMNFLVKLLIIESNLFFISSFVLFVMVSLRVGVFS